MSNDQKKSAVEQIVGYVLLFIIILTFIYYIFQTPDNADQVLPVVRFLAAIAAGIAASLIVGNLDIVGQIPATKGQIRAGGGLAAFVVVFLLFNWGISPGTSDETPNSGSLEDFTNETNPPSQTLVKPFSDQTVTALNSYLALAIFNPDTTNVPASLAQELELSKPPLILRNNNPVIEAIDRFIIETGNEDIAAQEFTSYQSAFHQNGQTATGNLSATGNVSATGDKFEQSLDDFYAESTVDERFGGAKADYAAILTSFQDRISDANWTALYGEPISSGTESWEQSVVQYPKLSTIDEYSLNNLDFGYEPDSLAPKESWLRQVIKENPDTRGLVGYVYDVYVDPSADQQVPLFERCTGERIRLVNTDILTPYVKFTDIKNTSDKAIRVDSLSYAIAGENWSPYTLNKIKSRSIFFQNAVEKKVNLNINLDPGQHIFIPIEFGLQPINRRIDSFTAKENLKNFIQANNFYFPRALDNPDIIRQLVNEGSGFPVTQLDTVAQNVQLSQDFKDRISASMAELPLSRMSIGSIMTVQSITVDGQSFDELTTPLDDVVASMSGSLGYGSCPYLLVYDSEKGYWIDLGPVLYQRNSAALKNTESYTLPAKYTKLKIEERESEISYIDWLEFKAVDPIGNRKKISMADLPVETHYLDGDSLILKQGESIEIDLTQTNLNDLGIVTEIRFDINGFYKLI